MAVVKPAFSPIKGALVLVATTAVETFSSSGLLGCSFGSSNKSFSRQLEFNKLLPYNSNTISFNAFGEICDRTWIICPRVAFKGIHFRFIKYTATTICPQNNGPDYSTCPSSTLLLAIFEVEDETESLREGIGRRWYVCPSWRMDWQRYSWSFTEEIAETRPLNMVLDTKNKKDEYTRDEKKADGHVFTKFTY
jgi:hypothetical protein